MLIMITMMMMMMMKTINIVTFRPLVPPSQSRVTRSRPVSAQQTFAGGQNSMLSSYNKKTINNKLFSGIGEDESPRTALATVDSAVTAPPPNLDQEVHKLMMRTMMMTTMFRLMSSSVVEEFAATSVGVFSRARGTRRARGSTAPIEARRESARLGRPAFGTPGSGAEAERVSSENASPPRSFSAPLAILSSPPPRALQGTSRRPQHLLGSQLVSAPQTSVTLTSARRRGESCRDQPQRQDQRQGGQPDEQQQQQQRDEPLAHQSPQNSHEGSPDCLAGRTSTQTLLDFSATPAAPSSTRTRSATSSTGRRSRKCKPASQTRLA